MHLTFHRRVARFALALAAAATLASCVPTVQKTPTAPAAPPPPPTADASFERIARRYLDQAPAFRPVRATEIGDHRFDARLDDVSEGTRAARIALAESLLQELAGLDRSRLTRAHQVDAALLSHELEYEIWRLRELADWRWNPLLYTDIAGGSIYSLMARDFASLSQRVANAGARLAELPRLLAQVRETLDPARVPKIHAETAVLYGDRKSVV